ncbi:hypothetical protein Dalu01_02295 [Deinococcus aluminii]|uniref:Uncharacterized protein n=1 Tax=Deinococcus aluminii TaxID=1656885 RepID=A0ABP9XEY6_9DEIO
MFPLTRPWLPGESARMTTKRISHKTKKAFPKRPTREAKRDQKYKTWRRAA